MLEADSTALVLIEYQNDFTSPGGTLHDAVKDVMASTNMLENTVAALAGARGRCRDRARADLFRRGLRGTRP